MAYGDFVRGWIRFVWRAMTVIFALYLIVVVVMFVSAVSDLGWGGDPRDAPVIALFFAWGWLVFGLCWLSFRLARRIADALHPKEPRRRPL